MREEEIPSPALRPKVRSRKFVPLFRPVESKATVPATSNKCPGALVPMPTFVPTAPNTKALLSLTSAPRAYGRGIGQRSRAKEGVGPPGQCCQTRLSYWNR